MKPLPELAFAALAASMLLHGPLPAAAQEPEKLDIPVFEVRLVDDDGEELESFPPGSPVNAEMRFVLALSASGRYASRITLIEDLNGRIREVVLFEGTLSEGFYRYRAALGRAPATGGEVQAKLILRTRIFPKKFTGESYYVYRSWEGSYSSGN